jgi:hypothetical protein
VTFRQDLFHPLIDAHGHFCFPTGQLSSVSCLTDPSDRGTEIIRKPDSKAYKRKQGNKRG